MKIVKSTDELKRLALSKGASVSVGRDRFNSTSEKVAPQAVKVEPKPEPKPEPTPAPVDLMPTIQGALAAMNGYAASAQELSQSNAKVMLEMQKALSQLPEPTEPLKERKWKLTVNRDTRGLLQSIDVEQK